MDGHHIYVYVENPVCYTPFAALWIPNTAKFLSIGQHANNTGAFQICELTSGKVDVTVDTRKSKGLKCASFGASPSYGKHLATGDFTGQLDIWDVERAETSLYTARAHMSIINCIDGVGGLGVGSGAPEIVTGSRDGTVKLWDPRQKDKPVLIMEPEDGQQRRECWAVAFGGSTASNERCIVSGYDNGDIKLFDLRLSDCVWETNVKNGVCSLEFDRKDITMNKLLATCLEGKILVYDMRTYHKKKGYSHLTQEAHDKTTVWEGRHLPHNRDVFVTTGGCGNVTLWKYNYPAERSKQQGDGVVGVAGALTKVTSTTTSNQPIGCFSWCKDKPGLAVTASFDQCVRVLLVTNTNTL